MLHIFRKLSIATKISLQTILGYILFGTIIVFVVQNVLYTALHDQARKRLDTNITIIKNVLAKNGETFNVHDSQLWIGNHALNNDNETIDWLVKMVSGNATLFMGDMRVATNIVKENGERAVGTRLNPGPIYDLVLKEGQTYKGEANLFGQDYFVAYDPIKDAEGKIVGIIFVGLNKKERLALIPELNREIIGIVLGLGLLLSGLAYLTNRRRLSSLLLLSDTLEMIRDGNTEVDVPAIRQENEIGHIARAVDSLKDKVRENHELRIEQEQEKKHSEQQRKEILLTMADEFQTVVKKAVDNVGIAVEVLKTSTQAMTEYAGETSKDAETVSAAASQASTNVQSVAAAAEELNTAIREINGQISESASIAATCAQEAETTGRVMQALSQSADEIGSVLRLIEAIANQVNLLALNATIEAARAGDAGKGFAVVAGEVKNLANQVGNATKEISSQISTIQGQTSKAVTTIDNITATISRVNQISSSIAAAVEQQGAATQEISRSIQTIANDTSRVTDKMTHVTNAVTETGLASSQLFETVRGLSQEAETLTQTVDGFLTHIRNS